MQPCSQPRYGFSENEKPTSGLSLWVISEREVSRSSSVTTRPPPSAASGLSGSGAPAAAASASTAASALTAGCPPRAWTSGSASTRRRSKRLAGFWTAPRPLVAGDPLRSPPFMPPLYCIRQGAARCLSGRGRRRSMVGGTFLWPPLGEPRSPPPSPLKPSPIGGQREVPPTPRTGWRVPRRRLLQAAGELLGALLVGGRGVVGGQLTMGGRGHLELPLGGGHPAFLQPPPGLADHDRFQVLDALGQLGPSPGERRHLRLQLVGRGAELPLLRLERHEAPDVRRQDRDDRNQNPPIVHDGVPSPAF